MKKLAVFICLVLLPNVAYAQRFRCVVSAGGVQIHTSTYNSADACYAACRSVAIARTIAGSRNVTWRCMPE